jgi:hypothetical protein
MQSKARFIIMTVYTEEEESNLNQTQGQYDLIVDM